MAGHPLGLPDLLLDRSLGSIQVPARLRAALSSNGDAIDWSCRVVDCRSMP
jgi:hypothetical protein